MPGYTFFFWYNNNRPNQDKHAFPEDIFRLFSAPDQIFSRYYSPKKLLMLLGYRVALFRSPFPNNSWLFAEQYFLLWDYLRYNKPWPDKNKPWQKWYQALLLFPEIGGNFQYCAYQIHLSL
jgi:hypothetical protein